MTDPAAAGGAVLFVDDEDYILRSLPRLFPDAAHGLLLAGSAAEALDIVRSRAVAVVVSGNRMPGTRGTDLLARVREVSPDTTRILMTAYADRATAADAVNRGEAFRSVAKPWDDESLVRTVNDGIRRYRAIQALRRADETALRAIAQDIELKDPYTRGHCDRVARYALLIAGRLGLPEETTREIRYGSWLHDCGKVGVPEAILNFEGPLREDQFEVVRNHPRWGADMARQAGLSDTVVAIILHHHERVDGKGYPAGKRGADVPLEARIVAAADTVDAVTTDRPYRKGSGPGEARRILLALRGKALAPDVTDILLSVLSGSDGAEEPVLGPEDARRT